jgi:serine/threonine protein kinase
LCFGALKNTVITSTGHVKLTDFGASISLEADEEAFKLHAIPTTNYSCAPEVIRDLVYTFASEYWSFGTCLFEMAFGRLPFYNPNQDTLFESILKDPLTIPQGDHDPDLIDLLTKLLDKDPSKRPDLDDIFTHPFFSGIDWKSLPKSTNTPDCDRSIGSLLANEDDHKDKVQLTKEEQDLFKDF